MSDEIRKKLVVTTPDSYGVRYRDHCVDIYRLYVQMADNVSVRRQSTNSFYLSVNTLIVGAVGVSGHITGNESWMMSIAGVVLCYSWYRSVRSYRDLNTGKYLVIHEIEKELPLTPYDAEWVAIGKGRDPRRYLPFTHIEIWVPIVFGAFHFGLIVAYAPWAALLGRCAPGSF